MNEVKIKKIVIKKNRPFNWLKLLLIPCELPRVISCSEDLRPPNSASAYLMLKAYYAALEKMSKNRIMASTHNFLEMQVAGQTLDVSSPSYNFEQLFAIFNQMNLSQSLDCCYCHRKLNFEEVSLDHYIPRSAGGEDKAENYRASCLPCNRVKSSIHPYKDKKLFNFFKAFVKEQFPQPAREREFSTKVLESNLFSIKEYPVLIKKMSLSLSIRLNMTLDIQEQKIPFNPKEIFNFSLLEKQGLDDISAAKVKKIIKN